MSNKTTLIVSSNLYPHNRKYIYLLTQNILSSVILSFFFKTHLPDSLVYTCFFVSLTMLFVMLSKKWFHSSINSYSLSMLCRILEKFRFLLFSCWFWLIQELEFSWNVLEGEQIWYSFRFYTLNVRSNDQIHHFLKAYIFGTIGNLSWNQIATYAIEC